MKKKKKEKKCVCSGKRVLEEKVVQEDFEYLDCEIGDFTDVLYQMIRKLNPDNDQYVTCDFMSRKRFYSCKKELNKMLDSAFPIYTSNERAI